MTILPYKIRTDGDEILHQVCEEVSEQTPKIFDMIETLKHALTVDFKKVGAGLAGNQIGFPFKIIAINFQDRESPYEKHLGEIWLNPKVIWSSERKNEMFEGCLSFPNILVPVVRPAEVKISAMNEKFETKTFRAKYFYAKVLQHEIDHINGITFLDRGDKSRIKLLDKQNV